MPVIEIPDFLAQAFENWIKEYYSTEISKIYNEPCSLILDTIYGCYMSLDEYGDLQYYLNFYDKGPETFFDLPVRLIRSEFENNKLVCEGFVNRYVKCRGFVTKRILEEFGEYAPVSPLECIFFEEELKCHPISPEEIPTELDKDLIEREMTVFLKDENNRRAVLECLSRDIGLREANIVVNSFTIEDVKLLTRYEGTEGTLSIHIKAIAKIGGRG